ncbi:hypothetical protein L873DRAFT_468775 [Choiromyces venosus 120613-1]|uniref:Uncharacterized protein n=1 Tax=Choiromyces venosus 120613-1 TaxID=1336337 RepID=A0A3N4J1J4_9PEZI|nr:hypothetical protein L873DRAFT_468775 [Choiromyces venosus 120613-1]
MEDLCRHSDGEIFFFSSSFFDPLTRTPTSLHISPFLSPFFFFFKSFRCKVKRRRQRLCLNGFFLFKTPL